MAPQIASVLLKVVSGPARRLWHVLPKPVRYVIWTVAGIRFQSFYARQMLARPSPVLTDQHRQTIVVAGLFSTANGIGEAARSTYRALLAAGANPIAVDLSERLAPVDMVPDIETSPMPDDLQGTLILQLNGPEVEAGLEILNMRYGREWYTIGYWAWELPTFPDGWDSAFKFLSEIWTISSFSADALRQHPASPPISVIHHAIEPPDDIATNQLEFSSPEGAFVFLTMADSMSSLQRKNPFAAITAFKSAFGNAVDKHLIIKTRNLERDPDAARDLNETIGDASNISLIDRSVSEMEMWSLLDSCDALISLHRCEGFGLVIAEAMALGKPVIATNWSGNLDFTSPERAYLVDADLIPNADEYGVYSKFHSEWADVRAEHAVAQLKAVAANSEERERRSAAAKAYVHETLSSPRIGQTMLHALDAVRATVAPGAKQA